MKHHLCAACAAKLEDAYDLTHIPQERLTRTRCSLCGQGGCHGYYQLEKRRRHDPQ